MVLLYSFRSKVLPEFLPWFPSGMDCHLEATNKAFPPSSKVLSSHNNGMKLEQWHVSVGGPVDGCN